MSCPLKGWKPALCGDAGLQGEAWPDRPREALRLRLLSRPRFLSPPPMLARRRSRRPVGGGWLSSSPSSCRRVIWGNSWLIMKWEWWQVLPTGNFSIRQVCSKIHCIHWTRAAVTSLHLIFNMETSSCNVMTEYICECLKPHRCWTVLPNPDQCLSAPGVFGILFPCPVPLSHLPYHRMNPGQAVLQVSANGKEDSNVAYSVM